MADLAGISLSLLEKIELGIRAMDNKAVRVAAVARMRHVPDWAGQMAALPTLIGELSTLTSKRSRFLLMDCLYSASQALKFLGHLDLAMYASERASMIAGDMEESAWLGFAGFAKANAVPAECPDLAAAIAVQAAMQIRLSDRNADLANIYGQLHLCAGLLFATAKQADTSSEHLTEASGLAVEEAHEGGFRHLQFGPANAARYRMKASLELGNAQRALAISKEAAKQRTPFLQASYHIAAGRALHNVGRDLEAIAEFDLAERTAPQLVHVSPSARTTVETILTRRAKLLDARQTTNLARRMGIYLPHKL